MTSKQGSKEKLSGTSTTRQASYLNNSQLKTKTLKMQRFLTMKDHKEDQTTS